MKCYYSDENVIQIKKLLTPLDMREYASSGHVYKVYHMSNPVIVICRSSYTRKETIFHLIDGVLVPQFEITSPCIVTVKFTYRISRIFNYFSKTCLTLVKHMLKYIMNKMLALSLR